ncbi:MAG: hypothetical protein BGO70_14130 [Bacteroidetes bacterium 43-93]|nr:hypothetical protein [Bacteroidota bacterium]OJW99568.1 MAG: hypothetical protein BGO70_14130 [Bacteroidetes bacterium 43-93]
MKITLLALSLALFTATAYAQSVPQSTKKATKSETGSHMHINSKGEKDKGNTTDKATLTNPTQKADRTRYTEPINPRVNRMNANGNNTPVQNATRVMNEGPQRSAIDTSKIR